LNAVNASSGALTTSTSIGFANPDIGEAPLVDSSAGKVYVFVGDDGSSNDAVFQFPYDFPSGSAGTSEALIGSSSGNNVVYTGDFNNAYYTSTPSSPTGNLYVCGDTNGSPILYQISIAGNTMSPTVGIGPTLTSTTASCSPVTEVFNSPTDWIFLSVTGSGNVGITSGGNPCTGSCVYSFKVNSSISTATKAANGLAAAGGSGAIVIDNTASSPAGTSQIYFSSLANQACTTSGGTGGCAIQASQSTLR
jgi:hypothetical protein